MDNSKLFAFVLMPFQDSFKDIYNIGIKQTAKDIDITAERLDEQLFNDGMLDRIYRQIDSSDIIIADMSGRNPNVFYEVGYAHAHEKLCILLTSTADDIPFDLKHRRHIVYNSITDLKDKLSKNLEWAKQEVLNIKNSKIRVELKTDGILEKNDFYDIGNITHTFDLHNDSNKMSTSISAIYLHTGNKWDYKIGEADCAVTTTDIHPYKFKYFISPPLERLEPKTWSQFKISGKRTLASTYRGDKLQDSYDLKGSILLRIVTSIGNFDYEFSIDKTIDTLPF